MAECMEVRNPLGYLLCLTGVRSTSVVTMALFIQLSITVVHDRPERRSGVPPAIIWTLSYVYGPCIYLKIVKET